MTPVIVLYFIIILTPQKIQIMHRGKGNLPLDTARNFRGWIWKRNLFSVLFFDHNLYFWISWYYRILLSAEFFETIIPGEKGCYSSGDCFYASVIIMIFPALPWLTGNSNEVWSLSPPFLMDTLASFVLSCPQCSIFISMPLWCISLIEWLLYLFSYQKPSF